MISVVIHRGVETGADTVNFFRNFTKPLQFLLPQFFAISHEKTLGEILTVSNKGQSLPRVSILDKSNSTSVVKTMFNLKDKILLIMKISRSMINHIK
jgi:hypothetical protein